MTIHQFLTPDLALPENLTEEDYLTHTFIARKSIAHERTLFDTKWFDYAFMSPFEATMIYLDEFEKAARAAYARELDYSRAEHIPFPSSNQVRRGLMLDRNPDSPIDPERREKMIAKAKSNFTGAWRGRQVADMIGMPYSLYTSWAIEFRMRRWQRAYLPKLNQLYHEFDVEKIVQRWETYESEMLVLPTHEAFLVKNYVGLAAQNRCHDYLFALMKNAADPSARMARFIRNGYIGRTDVAKRVEHETMNKIESYLD